MKHAQFVSDQCMLCKEGCTLLDGEIEHFRDTFAVIFDFQRFLRIACPIADAARGLYIRHKVQVGCYQSLSTAFLAATTLDVEAKARGGISAGLRFWYGGEDLPDGIINPDIGCRRGGWQPTDRRLIDVDDV